jgi:hypothetical protein
MKVLVLSLPSRQILKELLNLSVLCFLIYKIGIVPDGDSTSVILRSREQEDHSSCSSRDPISKNPSQKKGSVEWFKQ